MKSTGVVIYAEWRLLKVLETTVVVGNVKKQNALKRKISNWLSLKYQKSGIKKKIETNYPAISRPIAVNTHGGCALHVGTVGPLKLTTELH